MKTGWSGFSASSGIPNQLLSSLAVFQHALDGGSVTPERVTAVVCLVFQQAVLCRKRSGCGLMVPWPAMLTIFFM